MCASLHAEEAKAAAVESRFMPEKERSEWVRAMRLQLQIADQDLDAFGLSQSLIKKPVEVQQKVAKPVNAKAFAEAVAAMKVPIVMGNVFVIGSREFRKGVVFSLERKGDTFKVLVVSVNTKQITFKNVDTDEQVIKPLGNAALLKPDQGFKVDGFTPANQVDPGKIKVNE